MRPGHVTQEQLTGLIDANYAAAEDSSLWPDFLGRVAEALGASFALILIIDQGNVDGTVAEYCRLDSGLIAEYQDRWRFEDPWITRSPAAYRRSRSICESQAVASNAVVARTSFCNEFLYRCNSFQNLTGTIYAESGLSSLLSCHYPRKAGYRTREEIKLLQLLMPHMQRAVSLHRRLRRPCDSEDALRFALDLSPGGFLLLDEVGRVVWANSEAERILEEDDGLRLRAGVLGADDTVADNALAAMCKSAIGTTFGQPTSGAITKVPRPSGEDPYQLMASAVSVRGHLFLQHRAAVVVMLRDPAREVELPFERLAVLYGFTPREALVAQLLVGSKSPREIADHLQLTENTVRTHLKSIFHKAGIRSQAELVRKLLQGLAAVTPPQER